MYNINFTNCTLDWSLADWQLINKMSMTQNQMKIEKKDIPLFRQVKRRAA